MSACEWNPTADRLALDTDPPHADAAVNIPGYEGGIHLCDVCAALPVFARFRKRSRLAPPAAIPPSHDSPSPMARPKNLRGGRKPRGPAKADKQITVRMTSDERTRIEDEAARHGTTPGALMRDRGLECRPPTNTPADTDTDTDGDTHG